MKLSLCITTYNRYEMTIQSFEKVLNDDRIDDIVIMDDCSTDLSYINLRNYFAGNLKVNIYTRNENVGMSRNKHDAIAHAKNKWCILFDSDNILDTDYLDAFYKDVTATDGRIRFYKDDEKCIFCPDFAKPNFDYTKFSNRTNYPYGIYNADRCAKKIHDDQFNCLMNTCNYIVNRDFYLQTYKYNADHIASDTIWHNYNHLKAGGEFRIVQNMQYFHRVHAGSGFRENIEYNMIKSEEVRLLIQQL